MLEIRRYEDADHDAVWQLHNEALRETGEHAGNGPWDRDLHEIESVYLDGGGEFLVGTREGRIVAMGALRRTSAERAEIRRMRVTPGCQRRGFGTEILRGLERRAKEMGYEVLHLDTTIRQVAAQKLYERHGYTETGRGRIGSFECIYYEKRIA